MGALSQQTAAVGPSPRLAGLNIGVYGSGGAPWHHLALLAVHGAEVAVVRAEDVAAGRLEDLDALIVPGGGATAMVGLVTPLGEAGATAIRQWVERGGTYVGSCAGSVIPVALTGAADAAVPAARCLRLVNVPLANTGDDTLGGLASPGVGRIRVRLDGAHPFSTGLPETIDLVHYNGPLFDVGRASREVQPFAWPVSATEAFTHAEDFLASRSTASDKTLERCIGLGAATGVVAPVGAGRALLFGSHPEFGLNALGLGWADGEMLLVRALEVALSERAGSAKMPLTWRTRPTRRSASTATKAQDAVNSLSRAAERFTALAGADAGEWLARGIAAEFHGTPALRAWPLELSAAAEACEVAARQLADSCEQDALSIDARWLDDAQRPDQDFGAMGLLQLAGKIHSQLDCSEGALKQPPVKPAHAYDMFDSHPFHLAMGSYLSAAGMAAAALLTVTVMTAGRGKLSAATQRLLWKGT